MAGLNVAEWSPEQVADWLTGLGPSVAQYVERLRARGLDGHKLLMLRCDDLEYLGVHVIGHQELVLEAVDHLRNFQYELSRECIQQLALKVSVAATTLSRALRPLADARLETQTLADVARTVHAVKPLVCWLDRWAACSGARVGAGAALAERKAALLKLALEAATCAQRDRFAEQPARAVAAAAAAAAAAADYIVQEVCDPVIVTPATLDAVCVRQRGKPLGFDVVPSYCGHHQLADIRFGSPAHASGAVHAGDEIVQVGGQCVIGWSGAAVREACARAGGTGAGELALRVRRRGARPSPALAPHPTHTPSRALYLPRTIDRYRTGSIMSAEVKEEVKEAKESPASSSDESEPLSPPASPTQLHLDHTRMYPPKPCSVSQRRHSVSGGSPPARRPRQHTHQFWQQLLARRAGGVGGEGAGGGGGEARGSAGVSPEPSDLTLYARDKAVSYSTGLETGRPRTCLGLSQARSPPPAAAPPLAPSDEEEERARGKLDKSHSTPAYDFLPPAPAPVPAPAIPESPPASAPDQAPPALVVHSAEKADQILQFKKSSSAIGEAMQQRRAHDDPTPPAPALAPRPGAGVRDESTTEKILETINICMMQRRRRSQHAVPPPPDNRYSLARRSRVSPPPSPPSPPPRPTAPAPTPAPLAEALGVLRAVPRTSAARDPVSPLKPHRPIDAAQISVPLRHITAHDMRMLPRRSPPPPAPPTAPAPAPAPPDIVVGAQVESRGALSPSSAVRGIFPTSKSRSLKKKSSILAKRRCIPFVALASRGAAGGVWQRVRARHPRAQPRWAPRHLLLAHNLLYAYRSPESSKADCMIYLEGFTACAAGEVKSRAHAFKVYHTGTAFYFACPTRDAMLAWIQLIHHATLLPSLLTHVDSSHHFSETDYSETESEGEGAERRAGASERERDRDNKDKDKDKSKFGSLKKLTGRMQRSESQEQVAAAVTAAAASTATSTAASLDRKYLRFFTRTKHKDENKPKSKAGAGGPVPTEHYRSYRRVHSPSSPPSPDVQGAGGMRGSRRLPKPINYIHASNPNLVDFEKSDFVTKPALQPPKPRLNKVQEHGVGLVTLEQFMLQKQAEERRQLAAYSSRVLLGVQADTQPLEAIVADVIYGEVGAPPAPAPSAAAAGKPVSVRGRDGYEKIVYPDESPTDASPPPGDSPPPAAAPAPLLAERWRDSLRRNDKVHNTRAESAAAASAPVTADTWNNNGWSASGAGGGAGGGAVAGGVSRLRLMFGARAAPDQCIPASPPAPGSPGGAVGQVGQAGGSRGHYPHLQCPPVFHAETYSLSRGARPQPHPRPQPPPPHPPS